MWRRRRRAARRVAEALHCRVHVPGAALQHELVVWVGKGVVSGPGRAVLLVGQVVDVAGLHGEEG